jgi:hypothetical protein
MWGQSGKVLLPCIVALHKPYLSHLAPVLAVLISRYVLLFPSIGSLQKIPSFLHWIDQASLIGKYFALLQSNNRGSY